MAFALFQPGDIRNYPPSVQNSNRKLTVIDNWMTRYPKSGKFYTRYLYAELMDRLVEDCHSNIANEYDNMIVVQGREGTGKSSFAIRLAKALNPYFNMETDYIYTYEELVEEVSSPGNTDIGRVFWLDETSTIMNNRDAMTSSSKNMVELLEMMRSRGWTLIMCIPSVERLDKYLRDYRIRYLITVEEMEWDQVYTEKQRGFWSLAFKTGDSYETFKVIGYGRFDPMSEEEAAEYKAIKLRSQQTKMDEISGRDTKPNMRQRTMEKVGDAMLILSEQGVPNEELARKFDYAPTSIVSMLTEARKRKEELGDQYKELQYVNPDLLEPHSKQRVRAKSTAKLGDMMLYLHENGMSQEELAKMNEYSLHTVRQMLSEARGRRKEKEGDNHE